MWGIWKKYVPHCHYEVHKNGKKVNPVFYFSQKNLDAKDFDEILRLSSIENQL